ncbi:dihydropteroate synthase [Nocardioides cavernaquae]|uniref:Dihydropteroate synthase n=1 Tax=Nocardioides cavernaquae TaxID=2321396 RepID=A0A3A5HDK7_9ACTN|nr:dihydropteroate synthase [Nocardioides cavernaquae]RJS46080.1 dihydropteroate synthase [Nocardioides cavernaquae]
MSRPVGGAPSGPSRYVEGLPQPGRTLVMGVVNVTPDSFSDGGKYVDPAAAVAHGLQLAAEGADVVDVGGESTRPGATRPSVDEELARVVPVVEGLAAAGIPVSVDTMRAQVAEAAVAAGAALVNDVSGGLADDAMLSTLARLDVPCVLMHWRGHSIEMQQHTDYGNVVDDVLEALRERVHQAARAGITHSIAIDPGIGFAKTTEQNWALLRELERFHDLGHPLLVATSRKRFLGVLLEEGGVDRPPAGRDDATTATTTLAAARGAWCVRVHAVRASADAVRVAARWTTGDPS